MKSTGRYPYYSGMGTYEVNCSFSRSTQIRLLAKSRNIDLRIYTDTQNITQRFSVIQERLSLKKIFYKNQVNTEEKYIERYILYIKY